MSAYYPDRPFCYERHDIIYSQTKVGVITFTMSLITEKETLLLTVKGQIYTVSKCYLRKRYRTVPVAYSHRNPTNSLTFDWKELAILAPSQNLTTSACRCLTGNVETTPISEKNKHTSNDSSTFDIRQRWKTSAQNSHNNNEDSKTIF